MYDYDYKTEVGAGAVGGKVAVLKFGRNVAIAEGTDEDVWDGGGTWVAPTAARIHNLASSAAADTAAGTGARTITIQGLDEDWLLASETITLNGTSNVATTRAYRRVFRMRVLTAGSGGTNAGNITATAAVDGTVTAQINATFGQTLMAIYTVPAGRIGLIHDYYFGLDSATVPGTDLDSRADGVLLARENADEAGSLFVTKHIRGVFAGGQSTFEHEFHFPLRFEGPCDIKMRCENVGPTNATVTVTAGFDMELRLI